MVDEANQDGDVAGTAKVSAINDEFKRVAGELNSEMKSAIEKDDLQRFEEIVNVFRSDDCIAGIKAAGLEEVFDPLAINVSQDKTERFYDPLQYAAQIGSENIVSFLIKKRAAKLETEKYGIEERDEDYEQGQSPTDLAYENGHSDIVTISGHGEEGLQTLQKASAHITAFLKNGTQLG